MAQEGESLNEGSGDGHDDETDRQRRTETNRQTDNGRLVDSDRATVTLFGWLADWAWTFWSVFEGQGTARNNDDDDERE